MRAQTLPQDGHGGQLGAPAFARSNRVPVVPIPRPRARVATGTLGADAKTAQRTARLVKPAGGALYLPQAPLATATRNSLGHSFARPHTSGCAGTQPGGRVIHLSTGAAEAGRLGGRRPVLTIFSPPFDSMEPPTMSISTAPNQGHPETLDPQRLALKRRLRMELDAAGLPHKALAIECGVDQALVSRWISEEHRDMPGVHHLAAITRELGNGFARALVARCGLELTDTPTQPREADDLYKLVSLLAGKSGNTVQALVEQLADGDWTTAERRISLPGLRSLHQLTGVLVARAEVMQ